MNPVVRYFSGEKAESYLFVCMSIATLLLACYFLLGLKTPFWKGAAIPFIVVAFLEMVVGITITMRSPKDIARVENHIARQPERIITEEIPRMETVMRNFVIFRYVEILLVICGLILMYAAGISPFWRGVGFGLFVQAGIVLCLDYFAETRGAVYLDYLRTFTTHP